MLSEQSPIPNSNSSTRVSIAEEARSSGTGLFGKIKKVCRSPWTMLTIGLGILCVALPAALTSHITISAACIIGGSVLMSIALYRLFKSIQPTQDTTSQGQHNPAYSGDEFVNELATVFDPTRDLVDYFPPDYNVLFPRIGTGNSTHVNEPTSAPMTHNNNDGLPKYEDLDIDLTNTTTTQSEIQHHRGHQSLNFSLPDLNHEQTNNSHVQEEVPRSPPPSYKNITK